MTERQAQDTTGSSSQLVNLNYLDREAEIYKASKNTIVKTSKELQQAVEQNTKQEVAEVEAAIKRLNEKVEQIMETKYVQERQKKIETAQQQMMKSIKEATTTFFQVRDVIRGKENLSEEEKKQYTEKLFHKILDKFMTNEEKDLFTRIISAGPLLMLSGNGEEPHLGSSSMFQLM
jgi:hypothetical protein